MLVVARPCEKPEVLCLTCSCVSVSSFSSTKVTKCFTKGEILVMIREFITLRELALSIGTKSSQKITVKQGNFVNLIFVLHPRVLGGVEKVLAEKRHRLEKRCWLPPPPLEVQPPPKCPAHVLGRFQFTMVVFFGDFDNCFFG